MHCELTRRREEDVDDGCRVWICVGAERPELWTITITRQTNISDSVSDACHMEAAKVELSVRGDDREVTQQMHQRGDP